MIESSSDLGDREESRMAWVSRPSFLSKSMAVETLFAISHYAPMRAVRKREFNPINSTSTSLGRIEQFQPRLLEKILTLEKNIRI